MMNSIYDRMSLPDACYLGKRVFKKLFYENADLTAADRQAFAEDVDSITWQYSLRPDTISILPYTDHQREYLEIAILQVDLASVKRVNRIAEIVHRAVPYPLVIVLINQAEDGGHPADRRTAISMAPKRFSHAEQGAIVAEEFLSSGWINLDAPAPVEADFLASLAISTLPVTHLYAFYLALIDRLVALERARITQKYGLESSEEGRLARKEALSAIRKLEAEIAQVRAAIKKETQFNRQVEMNVKLKQLGQRLQLLISTV